MLHGHRGGWIRARGAWALLCVGVVGCMDLDKPKDTKILGNTKQPGAGLPGTPRLPGAAGTGVGAAGTGQPGAFPAVGSGGASMGGSGGVGRAPTGGYPTGGSTNFGTGSGNNNYVPAVGPNTNYQPVGSGPVSPASGMGAGERYGVQPLAVDPGLTPPAAPGASGGVVVPPGSSPVAPTYPK